MVITVANSSEPFQAIDKIKKFSAVTGAGILLVSFLCSSLFARTITKPITQLIHYAEDVTAKREAMSPAASSVGEVENCALSHSKILWLKAEEAKQQAERAKQEGMCQVAS